MCDSRGDRWSAFGCMGRAALGEAAIPLRGARIKSVRSWCGMVSEFEMEMHGCNPRKETCKCRGRVTSYLFQDLTYHVREHCSPP